MPKIGMSELAPKLQWPKYFYQGFNRQYFRKVLACRPIAYWPLWEASGSVAYDISKNGLHGAYSGAALAKIGIGDGRSCPLLGGDGDHVNLYTTGLRDAWDGDELTVCGWFRVFNVGEWTSNEAVVFNLQADANNFVTAKIHDTNNQFSFAHKAGGTAKWVNVGGLSYTGWVHFGLTVSLTAGADGQMKGYLNGVQVGSTQTGLGTWSNNLVSGNTLIGATGTGGANPWYGYPAHLSICDSAESASKIASLALR